jgi:hypothetical protein
MRLLCFIAATALVACGSVATAGPPSTQTPASAEVTACSRAGYSGTVVGAFTLRASDLAQQEEVGKGPAGPRVLRSSFRDYAPDTPIVLCFFDGFIAAPGGPPPIPPATFRPYDRYVATVDPSGVAVLRVAGRQDTIVVGPRLP